MGSLKDIIKEDFSKCLEGTKFSIEVIKLLSTAVIRGIYTPLFMNTGINQIKREYEKSLDSNTNINKSIDSGFISILHPISAAATFAFSLNYATKKGMLWEYLGALAATNTIDYLVNAYKRSKKEETDL